MKKVFALLIALMLCCGSAFAMEFDVEQFTEPLPFTYEQYKNGTEFACNLIDLETTWSEPVELENGYKTVEVATTGTLPIYALIGPDDVVYAIGTQNILALNEMELISSTSEALGMGLAAIVTVGMVAPFDDPMADTSWFENFNATLEQLTTDFSNFASSINAYDVDTIAAGVTEYFPTDGKIVSGFISCDMTNSEEAMNFSFVYSMSEYDFTK